MEKDFEVNDDNEIKVILLGDSGIGKTSLINVAVDNKFVEDMPATISSSYVIKKFVKNNKKYILNIWDTAGQETYRALTKIFIKNSKIVIFVYSIDNKNSFENLKKFWISFVKEIVGNSAVFAIVGNKSDLYHNEKVKEGDASNYADSIGAKFSLTSAKTNKIGFVNFLEELLEEYINTKEKEEHSKSIELKKGKLEKRRNKCC